MPVPTFGETAARKFSVKRLSITIGHADLTAAATTETEALGSIPAGSFVLGVSLPCSEAFAGITGPVTIDIGSAGDVDALVDGANVTTLIDGAASTRPLGVAPNKFFAAATALTATFLSASGNLVDCTAGSVTIDILYVTGIQA